jgi:hypothetical protein
MQPSRCAVLADATPQRLLYFGGAVGAGAGVGAGAPRQSAAWPGLVAAPARKMRRRGGSRMAADGV